MGYVEQYKLKPCPLCGGTNIQLHYNTTYGHGDSGYSDGRFACAGCALAIGNKSDWGNFPEDPVILGLAERWNIMASTLHKHILGSDKTPGE